MKIKNKIKLLYSSFIPLSLIYFTTSCLNINENNKEEKNQKLAKTLKELEKIKSETQLLVSKQEIIASDNQKLKIKNNELIQKSKNNSDRRNKNINNFVNKIKLIQNKNTTLLLKIRNELTNFKNEFNINLDQLLTNYLQEIENQNNHYLNTLTNIENKENLFENIISTERKLLLINEQIFIDWKAIEQLKKTLKNINSNLIIKLNEKEDNIFNNTKINFADLENVSLIRETVSEYLKFLFTQNHPRNYGKNREIKISENLKISLNNLNKNFSNNLNKTENLLNKLVKDNEVDKNLFANSYIEYLKNQNKSINSSIEKEFINNNYSSITQNLNSLQTINNNLINTLTSLNQINEVLRLFNIETKKIIFKNVEKEIEKFLQQHANININDLNHIYKTTITKYFLNLEKEISRTNNKAESKVNEENNIQEKTEQNSSLAKKQEIALKQVRLAHWNVLNLNLNDTNEKLVTNTKIKSIAHLINYLNIDLQALTEIDNERAVKELTRQLNQINKQANWKYIISQTGPNGRDRNKQVNNQTSEFIAFIYQANKFKLKPFINQKINEGLAYDNQNFIHHYNKNLNGGYTRPPYGIFVETLGKEKNDFTFVAAHFDSPGIRRSTNNEIREHSVPNLRNLGAQEADEALNTINVMNYFDKHDGNNDDLIFMGDTNINERHHDILFDNLLNNGYKNLIDKKINTSLGTTFNRYSNSYDKIFIKSNLKTKNAQTYPLYQFLDDQIYPGYNNFNQWKNFIDQYRKNPYSSDANYIRNVISDHNPIYVDLILDQNDEF
ncbi:endonuclease/exonuclease/phosphatase family protein [Mycoplasma sp. 1018B]|uniref:endonuclease/exonuclease/phosphatase family protein n=1 Tax=Mycoplasma sp. 1018B TaxID=2967302 RepID=UPI00211CAAA7|nr:hypothetical protein [Mycoplasma sp. 1018B]UUM18985.1 hypothetical protein NPA14_01440 [Mycoplasma sp. 1018B]